jgi:uncharacterized membrane protein
VSASPTGMRAAVAEYRWLICVGIGALVYWGLPNGLRVADRSAVAWIGAVAIFLGWTAFDLFDASPEQLRKLARQEDPKRVIIFVSSVGASLVSLLAAIVLLKAKGGGVSQILHIVLVAGVVSAGWFLMQGIFTLHYAHRFYGDGPEPGPGDRGGLEFPGDDSHPDIFDFLYFSLVIGMTCQVSDVQITSKALRRLATGHAVLSFFFNTVILAITVNLAANAA